MRTVEDIQEKFKNDVWGITASTRFGTIMFSCYVKLPDCGTSKAVFGYNEDGYEHVSVVPKHKFRIPSWDDMARLKEIFFDDEEEAYQIMPKKSEYVNIHERCLHLWRPVNGKQLDDLVKM